MSSCVVCSKSNFKMFSCSLCKTQTYCSKRCQYEDWLKEHREYHYLIDPDIHVEVFTMSGENIAFKISKKTRVYRLQEIIEKRTSIPAEQQRIVCGETLLSNSKPRMQRVATRAGVSPGESLRLSVIAVSDSTESPPSLVDSSDDMPAGAAFRLLAECVSSDSSEVD